jgi:hypothetical protein
LSARREKTIPTALRAAEPVASPLLNPAPNPVHYLAGSGEMLLAKEAMEAEAFRAHLGSENGERYALQFRQAVQDLRRDFVPTPASAPGPSSQAFTLGFVPRAKLTKHQEELRKKALSRKMSRYLTSQELADINLKKRRREENHQAVPPSSAPAALASNRNEPPPRQKRAGRGPATPRDSETQDMDHWERQWERERLQDQGVLLESSSDEDEWNGDADSLDLCGISTQDRELMEGYDAQGTERRGDTQETAIEIE